MRKIGYAGAGRYLRNEKALWTPRLVNLIKTVQNWVRAHLMNRRDLKELANIRAEEAKKLLANGHYDGAYYLSGYVVECGLKACIAKQTKKYDFPDRRTVNESYTHDLTKLVKTAGLELSLDTEIGRNARFARNWAVVKCMHACRCSNIQTK